jgi:hypothetical protein
VSRFDKSALGHEKREQQRRAKAEAKRHKRELRRQAKRANEQDATVTIAQ